MERIGVILLAAGKGTRMKSDLPKALHPLGGRPLALWALQAANEVGPERIVVVVGHGKEQVIQRLSGQGAIFVTQEPQLGTGHAVLRAKDAFGDFTGTILVLSADVPAIKAQTLIRLLEARRRRRAAVALLTCHMEEPGAYGRIARVDGQARRIVEAKDASPEEKAIKEINGGIYAFDSEFIFKALEKVGRSNAQGEYYLTDTVALAVGEGRGVATLEISDPLQIQGVNTIEELASLERALRP